MTQHNILCTPEVITLHSGHRYRISTTAMVSPTTPDHHQRHLPSKQSTDPMIMYDLTMVEMATIIQPRDNIFFTYGSVAGGRCCCCCLPTPMALASGGSPMFPLVVHQPASPSIWPAVQSLRRGLSTNPGATMWCVCWGTFISRIHQPMPPLPLVPQ